MRVRVDNYHGDVISPYSLCSINYAFEIECAGPWRPECPRPIEMELRCRAFMEKFEHKNYLRNRRPGLWFVALMVQGRWLNSVVG
jgi:hypothetical protein